MGSTRLSIDIDFAVLLPGRLRSRPDAWSVIETALQETVRQTGIAANFASDIDRWSSITLLDYLKRTALYKRFGRAEVRILDPSYWAIGKLGRYLKSDIEDLAQVLKTKPPRLASVLRLWGRALRASPPSTACFQFRQNVEQFLRDHGRSIWGDPFELSGAVEAFHRAAGISP